MRNFGMDAVAVVYAMCAMSFDMDVRRAAVADVRRAVAKMRGAVASEAKGDRCKGEQCAEDETREKNGFHGAVWLVVYSSSLGVSTKGTENTTRKLRRRRSGSGA